MGVSAGVMVCRLLYMQVVGKGVNSVCKKTI